MPKNAANLVKLSYASKSFNTRLTKKDRERKILCPFSIFYLLTRYAHIIYKNRRGTEGGITA